MKYERTKNASRNIATGLFNKIISILMPFVIRTMIIKTLGMDYLGLDNLFASILQVLNLSELGLSSAISYCMYKPLAENNIDEVDALYLFVRKAYIIVGIVVLCVGLGLMPFLRSLINGDTPGNVNIYILYAIYLSNAVVSYFLFAYKNVLLNANQRLDISNNILTVTRLTMYFFQIIVLIFTHNYYIYLIVLPLSSILNNLITSKEVDWLFPMFKPIGDLSNDIKKNIKFQISGLFIGKLCQVTRNSFDSIIVSTFFGLTLTAVYNNYYYVMSAVVSVLAIFSNSIIPSIGNSIATESKEKNYNDFLKFNFLYMWIVGVCTTCLICLYQPFMKIWVGEGNMLGFSSAILFCIYFYSLNIGNIRAAYIEATGLWWQNRWRSILESISNLLLNIILGKLYGVNGIIFATIITIILINFIGSAFVLYKYYFRHFLLRKYFAQSFVYACVTFLTGVLSYYLTKSFSYNGILGLFLTGLVSFTISNLLFLTIFFHTNEFKAAKSWIVPHINRNK